MPPPLVRTLVTSEADAACVTPARFARADVHGAGVQQSGECERLAVHHRQSARDGQIADRPDRVGGATEDGIALDVVGPGQHAGDQRRRAA